MGKLNDMIICLIGKSGSGKTTIAEKLNREYGYVILDSYTTRQKRSEDETGHVFITEEEYKLLPNKVATNYFNGSYYCATEEQIESSDIYIVDPPGLKQLKEFYNGKKKIVSIYISVPMDVCLDRMRRRGDSEDNCWERLRNDDTVFRGCKGDCDYVINGIPETTWFEVNQLIRKESRGIFE